MQKVDLSDLECSICLKTINEPKLLTCSHTFCQCCLERLSDSQVNRTVLPCPICKKTTAIPKGEVSNLQTYQALKSIVDDMRNKRFSCTACENESLVAEVLCGDCGKYMCSSCHKVHSAWKGFSTHHVLDTSDLSDGRVTLKKRAICKKHPDSDNSCFCINDRMYICHCEVLAHTRKQHEVLLSDEHEEDLKENILDLKARAEVRKNTITKYVSFVEEQQQLLDSVLIQINEKIDEAYEDSVRRLGERKTLLRNEVKRRIDQLEISLKDMLDSSNQQIIHVEAATELICHGIDNPLEKDSLTAHDTLCAELSAILDRENPDYKQPSVAAKRGEKILFERNRVTNELELGRVQVADWASKMVEFPMKNTISAMSAMSDGTMALASNQGGVDILDFEGRIIGSVLKNVKIREIEFLSNGSYVIRDKANNISIFNKNCEPVHHSRFETLRSDEAGTGDLAIDQDNNIYVGYRKARIIQVFRQTGGPAYREIPCDGYEPSQVFALRTKNWLLVQSHSNSMRMIDQSLGAMKHDVTLYDNVYGYPALCPDDSILIAWVKHEEGIVSIDQYNTELKHVQTLIADFKIEKPEKRHWYYLQQYVNGAIAFCTPDRIYIFRQALTAADV